MEHLADIGARAMRWRVRLDVVDDEEVSLHGAGTAAVNSLPNTMELGEPGGVICTTRQSFPSVKSPSIRHPRLW